MYRLQRYELIPNVPNFFSGNYRRDGINGNYLQDSIIIRIFVPIFILVNGLNLIRQALANK